MHTGSEVLTRTGKCVSSPLLLFCWVTCERTDERGVCVCVSVFVCVCVCVCVERGHGGCSSMPLWGVLGTDGQTVLKSMMVCQHGLLGPATSHPTLPFVCHRYIFTTP